jgi:hypothetical protein
MDHTAPKQKINPLTSLMRQPKIYIRLPSNGRYWAEGSLDLSPNGEYAVYSMTARDELLLKTPDALLNGQAMVDVVEHCVPSIKNAWEIPSIDLDVILIAIRMATYGEKMDTTVTIGEEDLSYTIDLRMLMDQLLDTVTWDERINVGTEIALFIQPVNYKVISQTSIQNFETQKIMRLVNDSSLSEEEKIVTFRESFKKLTDISVGIINNSVFRVESSAGTTDDRSDILEFMDNCDKAVFDAIKQRLDQLKEVNSLKPIKVRATPEMLAAGSTEEIEIPLIFDPANFFD